MTANERTLKKDLADEGEMSILIGPFKRYDGHEKADREEEEDLLVFGYACKLYRDDAKALMEDSGQLLIPWMGDHSLMVDRYDVRNRLDDKNQFGLKSNLPYRPTTEEVELEEELDRERYLALECDDIRVAEQEEEEKKRRQESSFSAVGFSYNTPMAPASAPREEDEEPPLLACYPQRQPEHPPTSSVDHGENEKVYVPPPGLIIPNYIKTPATNKFHSIIEKTALFIVKQGVQMEIIIKAKQKFNPFFSFLDHNDDLFPYYQHVKEMLRRGAYTPKQSSPVPPPPKPQEEGADNAQKINSSGDAESGHKGEQDSFKKRTNIEHRDKSASLLEENGEESSSDNSDSDDEWGGYLHPLLMGGRLKNSSKSSTPTPGTREASPVVQTTSRASTTTPSASTSSVAYTTSSIAFYSKRMSINSAPVIDTRTSSDPNGPPRVATSSSGASTAGGGTQQYDYGSSVQEGYPPSSAGQLAAPSSSYPGQYSYGHQPEQLGIELGTQYLDVHSSQSQYYTQGSIYYDGTGGGTTANSTAQYDHQAYYYQSTDSSTHQYDGAAYSATPPAPPPPPPPSDILPVMTKTAEYVAKNGDAFERTVIERHAGDPRFGFLNPWDKSHAYYQMLKQQHRHRLAYEAYSLQMGWNQAPLVTQDIPFSETNKENIISEPTNLQRLNESGAVSFKLQPPKPATVFDPSSLVDLGSSEDVAEEDKSESASAADCNGYEEDGAPPSKKPRTEWTKMGTKVEEFLSTVKAIFGTE